MRSASGLVLYPLIARPGFHPLEMRDAVRKTRHIEFERSAAPEGPEEVRVRGCEVVEEKLATGEQTVGDFVVFKEQLRGQPADAVASAGDVANPRRCVDPGQIRMDARRAPRQQ